jgi:ATP-binding cassette subfamily B (MDR/TAP) protein 1
MSSKQDAALTNGGEHARAIIERQLNGIDGVEKQSLTLLTYATTWDKAILLVSSICAILAGALNPLVPVSKPSCTQTASVYLTIYSR